MSKCIPQEPYNTFSSNIFSTFNSSTCLIRLSVYIIFNSAWVVVTVDSATFFPYTMESIPFLRKHPKLTRDPDFQVAVAVSIF